MANIILEAKNTIHIQARAVEQLSAHIDDDFEAAVNTIYKTKGRVIITGIGKSSLICQKIVSTFNSTGTPAIFMHAADAVHGDLGMIQSDDVVIVISKSGESAEIKYLIPIIKEFGNKIIALTGNIASYLSQQSDIVLNTTITEEACPNNLAPTTSTTVQMVMGDALAICLMYLNKFSGKDFAKYHPGGSIGKRLFLKVSGVYKTNALPKVFEHTPLKEIIIEISKGRMGATAVLNKSEDIIGIVTDGDIRRMLQNIDYLSGTIAKDILSPFPKTIDEDELAVNALEKMKEYDISQLIVTNAQNKYVGMIHIHDLLREGIF